MLYVFIYKPEDESNLSSSIVKIIDSSSLQNAVRKYIRDNNQLVLNIFEDVSRDRQHLDTIINDERFDDIDIHISDMTELLHSQEHDDYTKNILYNRYLEENLDEICDILLLLEGGTDFFLISTIDNISIDSSNSKSAGKR